MHMKHALITTLFAAVSLSAVNAWAYHGDKYAKDAKLTIEQARALALKAYPGTLVEEELEKEKGGSGLRFSFDVRAHKVTHEVGIDAKTGQVLENRVESPNEAD